MTNATLHTNHGPIQVELYDDAAPVTVKNFLKLAGDGFYDGVTFHRVIPDFMIQGGDPTGTGSGGPGYQFEDEENEHRVERGALAMANAGPNTNGSQFFVVVADACPWLDGKHTVFGRVTEGLDVVDTIAEARPRPRGQAPRGGRDRARRVGLAENSPGFPGRRPGRSIVAEVAMMAQDVIGRSQELDALDGFLSALAGGPSGCVLDGAPGVGKTTLWLAGVEAARRRGYRVLTTRPAEAEARFAFAGLGDLLDPELEELLEALPPPQADALRVALLLERPDAAAPDERTVAVALLGSLRLLAAERPLVLAVDDLQWLDSGSALVLSFAWRRIRDEKVGLLAARRSGEPVPAALVDERLVRLDVRPLSLGAVHRLLRSRIELSLPRPTLRRIYDVAAGNAFFALELGRALERVGAVPAPGEALPVPDELQELVRDRIDALPADTRTALGAAAALAHPTRPLLAAAGHGDTALDPAFAAHVLELDGDGIRFTHPLLASAAYVDLDPESRRRLHASLAELVGDDEERARHRALATDRPDSDVAAELERAADHARRRGASSAAAELGERALHLTPESDHAAIHRRRITAALYSFDSGDPERAVMLLEEALAARPPGTSAPRPSRRSRGSIVSRETSRSPPRSPGVRSTSRMRAV